MHLFNLPFLGWSFHKLEHRLHYPVTHKYIYEPSNHHLPGNPNLLSKDGKGEELSELRELSHGEHGHDEFDLYAHDSTHDYHHTLRFGNWSCLVDYVCVEGKILDEANWEAWYR